MTVITDQMGRSVALHKVPERIVSLVPSITELLFDLGLGERVKGVTKFCIHPAEAREKAVIVGGTKSLKTERIDEIKPDLIIGSKEENTRDSIEKLARHYTVWMSDVRSVEDGIEMIRQIGKLCGVDNASKEMADEINHSFLNLRKKWGEADQPGAAYLIWNDPLMVAGKDNFIESVLEYAGIRNVFSRAANLKGGKLRYPAISTDDLVQSRPDWILLSSEPYPFKEKHIREFEAMVPAARTLLIDGEMFSWYGSKMRLMPAYLNELRNRMCA